MPKAKAKRTAAKKDGKPRRQSRSRPLALAAAAPPSQASVDVPLPQVSGNGYYSFSPAANQFGTQQTIDTITAVGRQWQLNMSTRPFGAGDISLKGGGSMPGHTTGHRLGKNVDLRPMRSDGRQAPVTWQDPAYDRAATQLLVNNFRAAPNCSRIFFNDPQITGVTPLAGHDNHLHVEMFN
jgi:penicillin-insensitive murein DD-endopeptidase